MVDSCENNPGYKGVELDNIREFLLTKPLNERKIQGELKSWIIEYSAFENSNS
jgi:hypothetical protein